MGVYRSVCYRVEDVFVKMLSKKKDSNAVQVKVTDYRQTKEAQKAQKKSEKQQRSANGSQVK